MTDASPLRRGHAAPPARTLLDVLRATTAANPDASALEDADGALSYRETLAHAIELAARLREAGVRRGDRVGIRMTSGTRALYLGILGILTAGAAYVPVDADDPEERAALVFGEAGVVGVLTDAGFRRADGTEPAPVLSEDTPHPNTASLPIIEAPRLDDDAWIIFTSGSTGTPKGVAVQHRSAAAFVDAEARLFLQDEPLGPGDRVLAGLSVAFDASCEEMWLAWRSGACLVPAPRALVRTGMDLGPWLVARGITVVSTVPTLAALWPADTVENVRLLIFGGEACPPELAARLAQPGREVWNTYGPTEATVVACAALMDGTPPIRIGLPLDGWDLAVVDADGHEVGEGEVGELVIGGVGLARYLDAEKDAQKYAPHAGLGWERAYRSGDLVRADSEGLVFQGRADDQVKVGGRRIELGEIEAALQGLDAVSAAAVAVRETDAGVAVLVGYLTVTDDFDRAMALVRLREELPAALVPMLAIMDELPVRVSGKVDKAALPWPLPLDGTGVAASALDPSVRELAELWTRVLGTPIDDEDANFFDLGGGSLTAAQLVSGIRERVPEFTVADVYEHPRLGAMAEFVAERGWDQRADETPREFHRAVPTPRRMQIWQSILGVPLAILGGARWIAAILAVGWLAHLVPGFDVLPTAPLWFVVIALVLFATPFGRMAIAVIIARALLTGVEAGDHPRGGGVHLRLWLAEQAAHQVGAASLAGAPWIGLYARALGARIARGVELHTLPPITGMLTIGKGAAIEPEVDLSGWWIDGDILRLGGVRIGAGATVGARSTLAPGARVGKGAEIAPGSSVFGRVPAGQLWAGSPAVRVGRARGWWPQTRPESSRGWVWAFAASSIGLSLLPVLGVGIGVLIVLSAIRGAPTLGTAFGIAMLTLLPATIVAGVAIAGLVVGAVRLLAIGMTPGTYAVRSRVGWQAWSTERVLDLSRTLLFPLYSSLFTPVWLRMLGATVGRNVEASTVLLLPKMTTIRDGAFLADDTLVAGYELGGGWMRLAEVEIGRRAFLGNSGMAVAGHGVPRDALVAVLSAAPRKSKPGSSWLGSPAMRLQRTVDEAELERTYQPRAGLKVARALWELCRFVPVLVGAALGVGVVAALSGLLVAVGPGWTWVLSGPVLVIAGALAAGVSTAAKWALVGRIRVGEHPLWSSFVWRTEVSDTFVEMVAAPWFANSAAGTPALALWLRSLGAKIGHGVWIETYWLPEADLARLDDGATVNRGCVVQTHLFHDRIMRLDQVHLAAGATLGPHSVVLPAASIGAHSTVGPASLVMRGETVPEGTRWSGNPIGPWRAVKTRRYQARAGAGH
ncbi:non-ribosomal peptide synthetase [Microbacterium sediminicola]|uniref:Non-ribosomal peptide synthetase n=1 Tax=Microbacterium sediminicola TaxID=415210 RepID=A0ABN2IHA0_9MICO